jgi:hypothetical protein
MTIGFHFWIQFFFYFRARTPVKMKKSHPLLLLFVMLSLVQCKKGEEDPSFTLKSRGKRLEGEWRMGSGYASFTYNYQSAYNESWSFDGVNFRLNTTESGPPVTYIGKYFLNLAIRKDGTFDFTEFSPYGMLQCSGTWCFTQSKGKEKKKESVLFIVTATQQGYTYSGIFNRTAASFRYHLTRLANKDMTLHSDGKLGMNSDSESISCETDYKFTSHEN